jgi:NAD(P)-dependent dehydrogenase (short-subunit alcohol dehydrogenase family)
MIDRPDLLAGRRALVTGASGGLGAHFAKLLARNGAELVLAARRLDALGTVAGEIRAAGGVADTVPLDVTSAASIEAAAAAAGTIDILVNNSGVTVTKPVLDQDEADWDRVVDTNLKGAFLMARAVGRAMRERGSGGSIVNIASILGLRQAGQVAAYAISKAGVIQMTKVMAAELARYGIRVNALAPGYFATEINAEFWATEAGKAMLRRIPQRRLGDPAELDGPLLLLASDASSYMTGSVIAVDGGHLCATL